MSGLILRLRPFEEFLINGVLVQNGDKKSQLRVKTEGTPILRIRDAMNPEEATTPERRAYYIAQLAVSGELNAGEASAILDAALMQLAASHPKKSEKEIIDRAASDLIAGKFYCVMRCMGELFRSGEDANSRA